MPRFVLVLCALSLVACGGGGGGGPAIIVPAPFTTFQPASVVIGQTTFLGGSSNQGGAVGANTLSLPGAPCIAGAFLLVPDLANSRVLGFAGVPLTNGASAVFALGQTTLSTGGIGTTSTTLNQPWAAASAGGKLFVSDVGNHRVLVWDAIPSTNGAAADVAIGQVDRASGVAGTTQAGLSTPTGIHAVGTKLLVCDLANNRVLIWNTIPTTNGVNADIVLGQADFTSGQSNRGNVLPDATTLNGPFGVWSDGTRLAVADGGNNRVLLWNAFPTTDGQAADHVLGQPDFASSAPAAGTTGMRVPTDVTSDGTRLIVGDCENNRILVFDAYPTASQTAATTVIGQGDFTHTLRNDDNQNGLADDPTPTARTMNTTGGYALVKFIGGRLYSGDHKNHRALIYLP